MLLRPLATTPQADKQPMAAISAVSSSPLHGALALRAIAIDDYLSMCTSAHEYREDDILLVNTAGQKSSVDHQRLTGNKRCGIGCEVDSRPNEFLCPAKAAHWGSHQ